MGFSQTMSCDLGGLAGGAQPLIKRFALTVGWSGHQCSHVAGAAAADAAASVPLTTFAWVRKDGKKYQTEVVVFNRSLKFLKE